MADLELGTSSGTFTKGNIRTGKQVKYRNQLLDQAEGTISFPKK
jgi:hypothetical protein